MLLRIRVQLISSPTPGHIPAHDRQPPTTTPPAFAIPIATSRPTRQPCRARPVVILLMHLVALLLGLLLLWWLGQQALAAALAAPVELVLWVSPSPSVLAGTTYVVGHGHGRDAEGEEKGPLHDLVRGGTRKLEVLVHVLAHRRPSVDGGVELGSALPERIERSERSRLLYATIARPGSCRAPII